MEQTISPIPTGDIQKEDRQQGGVSTPKATARWIGALFLSAFALYGIGALLIEQVTGDAVTASEILTSRSQLRIGALLIVANSVAVVAIGALMYRLATGVEQHIRLAYLGARLFEGVFLAMGAVFALQLIAAAESGDTSVVGVLAEGGNVAYQIGMIGLCAGSIALFWVLSNAQAIPRWLGLWGVAGYAIFGAGAALEIYGVAAGVILSIPGGIFEVTFAVYLLWKGALGQTTPPHTQNAITHQGEGGVADVS